MTTMTERPTVALVLGVMQKHGHIYPFARIRDGHVQLLLALYRRGATHAIIPFTTSGPNVGRMRERANRLMLCEEMAELGVEEVRVQQGPVRYDSAMVPLARLEAATPDQLKQLLGNIDQMAGTTAPAPGYGERAWWDAVAEAVRDELLPIVAEHVAATFRSDLSMKGREQVADWAAEFLHWFPTRVGHGVTTDLDAACSAVEYQIDHPSGRFDPGFVLMSTRPYWPQPGD